MTQVRDKQGRFAGKSTSKVAKFTKSKKVIVKKVKKKDPNKLQVGDTVLIKTTSYVSGNIMKIYRDLGIPVYITSFEGGYAYIKAGVRAGDNETVYVSVLKSDLIKSNINTNNLGDFGNYFGDDGEVTIDKTKNSLVIGCNIFPFNDVISFLNVMKTITYRTNIETMNSLPEEIKQALVLSGKVEAYIEGNKLKSK